MSERLGPSTSKMASTSGIPTNKGISVKIEPDDSEINAMALKMKGNYKKNATAVAKNQSSSPANVYINRAGRTVPMVNAPIKTNNTQNNNQEKLPTDCEDVESIKGRFSWKLIAGYHVPYIIRVIEGEHLMFVSVRMAETQLLSNYLHYLNADIYTCTSVKSKFISDSEAKLLNDINLKQVDCLYGRNMFVAGKDYIVRLEDVIEFRKFIELCYTNLLRNNTPAGNEKCGFIRINSDSIVPYCMKDSQKYVPVFFFEGETENIEHQAVKLENWDLAYLKFCCKIQGIRKELFASNSCSVINLDEIKSYYPPETIFEEYWPNKVVDSELLVNQSTYDNPSGIWIIAPTEEVVSIENNIPQTSTALSPAVQPLVDMNNYQNEWTGNRMDHSYSAQNPSQPTTDAYSIAPGNNNMMATQLQCNNSLPTMSQGSSFINSEGYVVPPGIPVPVIYNTIAYSNVVPISQCMTNMYNPMTYNNLVMSHSSQMSQLYAQHASMISQTYLQQLQQQQIQQIQQQQQIITTTRTQQSCYSAQAVHGCLTNTQQRNALGNVPPTSTAPVTDIIDLASSPPSSIPPTEQGASHPSNSGLELSRILEQPQRYDTSNNAPYKIQKVMIHEKIIQCINAKPYIYSDLMVILDDLVQTMLPFTTVESCGHALKKYLNTMLFNGNSDQLAVLRENGRLRSVYQNETLMASLHDVTRVFVQLRKLLYRPDRNIQQYKSLPGPSKRRRNN